METGPLSGVVALTADLMFASKISAGARARGVPCAVARNPEELADRIGEISPRLVLVDFSCPGVDWESLLPALNDRLSTRNAKLVGFTTHVFWKPTRPYHRFCDRVLTQEALARELPALLIPETGTGSPRGVQVLRREDLGRDLEAISGEVARRVWFRGERYECGVIAFHSRTDGDSRRIVHPDREVLCQVLAGRGELRLDDTGSGGAVALEEGSLIRIPAGVPHDFAATGGPDLVLWYALIAVGS